LNSSAETLEMLMALRPTIAGKAHPEMRFLGNIESLHSQKNLKNRSIAPFFSWGSGLENPLIWMLTSYRDFKIHARGFSGTHPKPRPILTERNSEAAFTGR
jgi:hypothetical protein